MNALVPISLFAWPIVALAFFSMMKPRRAVLVAFLGAWLFLPSAGVGLPGLPDFTKTAAASLSALLGVAVFDTGRLLSFKPRWFDLPMLGWCLVPMASSLTNGLGVYEGLSASLDQALLWGIPYLIGRVYFNTADAVHELAVAVFIGGLIYMPLCLLEVRMSPQLHRWVYGAHPSHFGMTKRFGGYRPMVFMQHGLMLGLWMTSATLIGIWLWSTGAVKRIRNVPMTLLVPALGVTTVLCKSAGALALLAGGTALLFVHRKTRVAALIVLAVAITPAYMVLRTNALWGGEEVIELAREIDEDRARSLTGRLENEDLIVDRALERPMLGWGGWGRWRVRNERGEDITVSDGLWVITLGQNGIVGLTLLTTAMLLPVLLAARRIPPRAWGRAAGGPAAALAVVIVIYMLDNLLNAMLNPVYVLAAGALAGLTHVAADEPEPMWVLVPAAEFEEAMSSS